MGRGFIMLRLYKLATNPRLSNLRLAPDEQRNQQIKENFRYKRIFHFQDFLLRIE